MLRRKLETVKTLLRVRMQLENLRAMELAVAVRARDQARAQRDRMAEALRESLMERARAQQQRFHPALMRHRAQYERHLAQLLDAAQAELQQQEQETENRRNELMEAARDRKIMEKLEERVTRLQEADLLKQERRELDDLASARDRKSGVPSPGRVQPGSRA